MKAHKLLKLTNLHKSRWGKTIIRAEKRGGFTIEEVELSQNWTTCACGEQDPRIPRRILRNTPEDRKLAKLGTNFYFMVKNHNFLESAITLIKIEKRSAKILNKIVSVQSIDSPLERQATEDEGLFHFSRNKESQAYLP